jgi:hypothetical protein
MSTKPDRPDTSDSPPPCTYQVARGVVFGKNISGSEMSQQVRRVVTQTKEGMLGLRYAPHDPKVTDVSTTS